MKKKEIDIFDEDAETQVEAIIEGSTLVGGDGPFEALPEIQDKDKCYFPKLSSISIPPTARDERGLLKNVKYVFKEDGTVDWRKMLKPEHFVPNREKTKETDISKIPDEHLLILLDGIKYLAKIRGYHEIEYSPIGSLPFQDYVNVKCTIRWIKNFEEDHCQTFSDIGDACLNSTKGFGSLFLGPIAANRAFIRCVRNYLGISIYGKEEMAPEGDEERQNAEKASRSGDSAAPPATDKPHKILLNKMKQYNPPLTFSAVKDKMIQEGEPGAKNWETIEDIPNIVIFKILERMNEKLKKAKS